MGNYYVGMLFKEKGLSHYGIKGQKWGVRRFQYSDGTLTPEGKLRYQKMVSEGHDMPSYFSQKLGDKVTSKIDKLWYDSLDELAYGDLVGGVKDKGRATLKEKIDEANNHISQFYSRYSDIAKKTRNEEYEKLGLNRVSIFDRSEKIERKRSLANETANSRLANNEEFQNLRHKIDGIESKISKLENQYKGMSISQIVNKFPKSQQEDVFDYLRLCHWEDQIYD